MYSRDSMHVLCMCMATACTNVTGGTLSFQMQVHLSMVKAHQRNQIEKVEVINLVQPFHLALFVHIIITINVGRATSESVYCSEQHH